MSTIRPVAPPDRDRFAEHASPEAVAAHLVAATRQLRRHERYVAWLSELLERRTAERAEGLWPPPTQRTLDGP